MSKVVSMKISGVDDECEKVWALLEKNRKALNHLFLEELGHECNITDAEMIGDALHSQLSLTRTAIRILLNKKLEE